MKKRLLLIGALIGSTFIYAQSLDVENYDGLALGNTHSAADLTFAAGAGTGGYFRSLSNGDTTATPPETSNNAANSNVQIVANGNNGTQGLQLVNPNGTGGFRQLLKNGFQTTTWASRTAGNDVMDVSVSFFTGPNTSSVSTNRFVVTGDDPSDMSTGNSIVAMDYDFNTREITGLGRLNNAGTRGFFFFQLGPNDTMGNPTALTAPANTWVTLTFSYNSVTGEYIWATDLNGGTVASFDSANFMIPGQLPVFNQVFGFSGDGNSSASTIVIDDYTVTARPNSILSNDTNTLGTELVVFPNPAQDLLNISSSTNDINSVALYDMNGREVLTKENFSNEIQLDIRSLSKGVYLLKVIGENSSITRKIVKE
ncbi:MAG: T9SS type A sorting domain-containing protein [Bacteroidota bacterium]|uniref:T9SS type A sorting domain-containing protein n=1 Tax=Nonlabens tegetincola TaxID=323273 RepID=UPI000A209146|nr:T9SS type A sorting domain-containing protein [Nonlabens tegetincola]ARN71920.1 hypothetical protein BST91_09790 [Nonlabens tegetincola]MEE2802424.1 T9SS type A sorting domain-containing protein [Bacteroidota bacterium]